MEIIAHRLANANFITQLNTPNQGAFIDPKYLVMHYTAGRSGPSSVEHFLKPAAKASAHLVIDRDGSIYQLVPFNRAAWHAGDSNWAGISGLNNHSIGIELDNAGRLQKVGDRFQAWFGAFYEHSEVIQAQHKFAKTAEYWHAYTPAQMDALLEVTEVIFANYELRDIVGHDDIAPARKVDPGPAFPMASFRARFAGRAVSTGDRYRVVADALNVRTGPGTEYPKVTQPLALGTILKVLEMRAYWANVLLIDGTQRLGWVRNTFIAPAGI